MRARSPKEIAAAARAEHKARRASLRTRIRSLDDLIAAPDVVAALDLEMLRRQRDDLQNLVTRLSEQLRSREWALHRNPAASGERRCRPGLHDDAPSAWARH
jgi:hypothetical protein